MDKVVITWRYGINATPPRSSMYFKGIDEMGDEMEGWDGGGRVTAIGDHYGSIGSTGPEPRDETAPAPNAFQYQQTLIHLDTLFAELKPEGCDAFLRVELWDADKEYQSGVRHDISPGEELTPVLMRLAKYSGNLEFVVRQDMETETGGAYIYSALNVSQLMDAMPNANQTLGSSIPDLALHIFEKKNREVIGSRIHVIDSLNAAIKIRSEASAMKDMDRKEKERRERYTQDDEAGMF